MKTKKHISFKLLDGSSPEIPLVHPPKGILKRKLEIRKRWLLDFGPKEFWDIPIYYTEAPPDGYLGYYVPLERFIQLTYRQGTVCKHPIEDVLLHEYGHHFWYHKLTEEQRAEWITWFTKASSPLPLSTLRKIAKQYRTQSNNELLQATYKVNWSLGQRLGGFLWRLGLSDTNATTDPNPHIGLSDTNATTDPNPYKRHPHRLFLIILRYQKSEQKVTMSLRQPFSTDICHTYKPKEAFAEAFMSLVAERPLPPKVLKQITALVPSSRPSITKLLAKWERIIDA